MSGTGGSAEGRDEDRVRRLFAEMAERPSARDEIAGLYLRLAERLAYRFRGRGESMDDLTQVARLGLVKAIDRFDPERGVKFSTYATATIVGELKRHLRDRGWSVRVPRALQEASLRVHRATTRLSQRLGRAPTVGELAAETGLSEEEVLEGLQAGTAYSAASIDAPQSRDGEGLTLADRLAADDEAMRLAERLADVADVIPKLPERQRHILYLRFYEDMSQTQIAEEVGISQMHVSRLLARALDTLRRGLDERAGE